MIKQLEIDSKLMIKRSSHPIQKEIKLKNESLSPEPLFSLNFHTSHYKFSSVSPQKRHIFGKATQGQEGNQEIEELLNVRTINKLIINSISNTPCRTNNTNSKRPENFAFSPTNLSDESNIFYPNSPKFNEHKKIKKMTRYAEVDVKIKAPKARITIQKSDRFRKRWQRLVKEHKFPHTPERYSENISKNDKRLKGRVYRGSCVYSCKSPLPKLIRNIKVIV